LKSKNDAFHNLQKKWNLFLSKRTKGKVHRQGATSILSQKKQKKKQKQKQTPIVHISLSHHHQQLKAFTFCFRYLMVMYHQVMVFIFSLFITYYFFMELTNNGRCWSRCNKFLIILGLPSVFLLLIKAITSFLYILELLGIVFLLVSSCNKVFVRFFYGCLFLQACVKVCRILYKIGVQFPHKLLDLQHLDVFVFEQPTCEICYTCELSFLNATMCGVRWPNLEWKFLASKKFVKKLRKKNSGNNDEKELV